MDFRQWNRSALHTVNCCVYGSSALPSIGLYKKLEYDQALGHV